MDLKEAMGVAKLTYDEVETFLRGVQGTRKIDHDSLRGIINRLRSAGASRLMVADFHAGIAHLAIAAEWDWNAPGAEEEWDRIIGPFQPEDIENRPWEALDDLLDAGYVAT